MPTFANSKCPNCRRCLAGWASRLSVYPVPHHFAAGGRLARSGAARGAPRRNLDAYAESNAARAVRRSARNGKRGWPPLPGRLPEVRAGG